MVKTVIMEINYTSASTTEELMQILSIQQMNLRSSVTATEMAREGFVTVEHSLELLTKMNNAFPHTIAKHMGKVVGYALSMTQDFKDDISVLRPMFTEIEKNHLQNYITMGQICVAKTHRKQGVFRGLYAAMQKIAFPTYTSIITEVDATNSRSLSAHYAIGFTKICTYNSLGQDWELIALKTG
ncbi:Predicted acetyltransferase, GNAT superfamily [Maribacter sedimenticola]|uniref:Predicted acetyltransferase, GNAT superfamily n=2 Tax=Maribacter sedimenticola TaxID=228956 RepID=A0ABY1SI74_9FLAO|nr:Predicted acetyltransferase, GNAT superfamily [Maribacter sedimenticola]